MTLADYGPQNPSIFNVVKEIDDASDREECYRQLAISHGSTPYIEGEANKIATSANYDLAGAKEGPRQHLLHCMSRAEAEVMRIYGAALSGRYDAALIQDPLFKGFVLDDPLATGLPSANSGSINLEEVAKKFLSDKGEVLAPKSWGDYNRVLAWSKSWFGSDTALKSINIDHVRGFRDQLGKVPANNSGPLDFAMANAKAGRGICSKTQGKYFSLLSSFLNWCVEEGYLSKSPMGSLKINAHISKKSGKRPLSITELDELLRSPIFTGFQSYHYWTQPGSLRKQTPDFWCFMIGMLSGMRIGEIVTLCKGNVRLEGQTYVFDVNEDADNKTVKSDAGIRLVPVHSRLLELGLLDWIKLTCKGGPTKPLFPSLTSQKEGDPASKLSKRLNRYLEKVGIKSNKTISFHSLRHGFVDQLRNSNVEEYIIHKVIGHAGQSVTSLYGKGASIERCKDVVDQCYQDLDFSVIKVKL